MSVKHEIVQFRSQKCIVFYSHKIKYNFFSLAIQEITDIIEAYKNSLITDAEYISNEIMKIIDPKLKAK